MQIKKHILNARSILFWQEVFVSLLWMGIFGSLLFLIGIELEAVFYFLPKTKINCLLIICGLFGAYFFFWLIQYFRSESDQIDRYKIETLSLHLGQAAFPEKQDTILNALQLESSSGENESKELAKSYINEISKKLKDLEHLLKVPQAKYALLLARNVSLLSREYVGFANHYHNNKIKTPYWAKGKRPVKIIGNHLFYKL